MARGDVPWSQNVVILSQEKNQRQLERKLQMKILEEIRMSSLSPKASDDLRTSAPHPITSYNSRSKYGIKGFENTMRHSGHIGVIDELLKKSKKTRNHL